MDYCFFFGFLAILLIEKIAFRKRKDTKRYEKNEIVTWIALPTISYFLFVSLLAPYQDFRYIAPICPLILLLFIYASYQVLQKVLPSKAIGILAGICFIGYVLFAILHIPKLLYIEPGVKAMNQEISKHHDSLCLYIHDKQIEHKFMMGYGNFLNFDETYILSKEEANTQNIQQIIQQYDKNKKGIFLYCYQENDYEAYAKEIMEVTNYTKQQLWCAFGPFLLVQIY